MGEADKQRHQERNGVKRQRGGAEEADAGRKSDGQVPFSPWESNRMAGLEPEKVEDETSSKTRLFTCLLSRFTAPHSDEMNPVHIRIPQDLKTSIFRTF